MGQSVRSLASEAAIPVRECAQQLRRAGLGVAVGKQRLDGPDLAAAREALGLARRRPAAESADAPGRKLDGETMVVRLLRPLREKGKVGREHTTAIENVYGHGLPDHLKADAKRRVEELLAEGCLAEKVSQGRRHVWLTPAGQARLLRAETATPRTHSRDPTRRAAA
jgi:hypothetical protein